MEKVCPLCGKKFIPLHGNRKYCSAECSETAHLAQASENAMRRYFLAKKAKTKCKKKRMESEIQKVRAESKLNENIRKADDCGLSYGKYMAFVFMGKTYEEILAMQGRCRHG